MSETDLLGVLTSIQAPTACVRRLAEVLARSGAGLLVVGDRKGPASFVLPPAELLTLEDQQRLPFALAAELPTDHYARKNLGYLLAIARKARCIYETDDDNQPAESWRPRELQTLAQPVAARPWMNVYRAFTTQLIWPRGFPLNLVRDPSTALHDPQTPAQNISAPIQQGLADQAPDVDAVWRLVLGGDFTFGPGPSLFLPPGTWCPFNSQSTWWWPPAYPLLYLPSHCSFRMTDIWRSFIAQRCLWEIDCGLVFHAPETVQERNSHDLMRDFKDEVPGYLHNQRLVACLERLPLRPGLGNVERNLLRCYEALVAEKLFPRDELALVEAWVEDLERLAIRPSAGQAA